MKTYLYILFTGLSAHLFGQFKQIPTGTNSDLTHLSVVKNNIFISGNNYRVKSYNECLTLNPIPFHGNYTSKITFRPDTNNLYEYYYSSSTNIGYLWKADGSGSNVQSKYYDLIPNNTIHFLDTSIGFMGQWGFQLKTVNGGYTWTPLVLTPTVSNINVIKCFKDSCIGMISASYSSSVCYLSKDKGNTWTYRTICNGGIAPNYTVMNSINYLSKDTLLLTADNGCFGYSTDFGQNWTITNTPIYSASNSYFKNRNEGYVIGRDYQGYGMIAKTKNMGATWSWINTKVSTNLLNMAIINDSIAILTGTKGVILRWNYKLSSFDATGLHEKQNDYFANVSLYPNPVKDKLFIDMGKEKPLFNTPVKLTISNNLGQLVFSKNTIELTEEPGPAIDASFLKTGVYYIRLKNESSEKVFKILKE